MRRIILSIHNGGNNDHSKMFWNDCKTIFVWLVKTIKTCQVPSVWGIKQCVHIIIIVIGDNIYIVPVIWQQLTLITVIVSVGVELMVFHICYKSVFIFLAILRIKIFRDNVTNTSQLLLLWPFLLIAELESEKLQDAVIYHAFLVSPFWNYQELHLLVFHFLTIINHYIFWFFTLELINHWWWLQSSDMNSFSMRNYNTYFTSFSFLAWFRGIIMLLFQIWYSSNGL